MTTATTKLQICPGMVTETTTHTMHGFWKSFTERLRSNYLLTHNTPNNTSETASDC